MKQLLRTLNEPFVMWLFSSVVVGFVSWQYAEIQRESSDRRMQEQLLKRARLELKLQLQDVKFSLQQGDEMTMAQLANTQGMLQYNALNQNNDYYVPKIPNVMLEIDSRTGSCGLEEYQERIYEHATNLSAALNRLWSRGAPPRALIYSELSPTTLAGMDRLEDLADEIQKYYAKERFVCDTN